MDRPFKALMDQELVHAFMEGNDGAFAELMQRHKSRIYTTIYLIVKDRNISEDLFQDAMVKIVNMLRARQYSEEGKFLPWAVRIARNLAIDHFRRDQRNPMQRDKDDNRVMGRIPEKEDNPVQKIIKEENSRYIRELIQQLPDKQREVLIMRHYAELSFREIADMTNVSVNTALGRMRYALINLRKLMDEGAPVNKTEYEKKLRQE